MHCYAIVAQSHTAPNCAVCRQSYFPPLPHLPTSTTPLTQRSAASAHCRAIRTRKFVEFTESDLRTREEKTCSVWASLKREPKVLPKDKMDAFYQRLQEDGEGRKVSRRGRAQR